MKTLITVMWARTVEIDVDEDKLSDPNYAAGKQDEAIELAGAELNWKDGQISDCEEFPDLIE